MTPRTPMQFAQGQRIPAYRGLAPIRMTDGRQTLEFVTVPAFGQAISWLQQAWTVDGRPDVSRDYFNIRDDEGVQREIRTLVLSWFGAGGWTDTVKRFLDDRNGEAAGAEIIVGQCTLGWVLLDYSTPDDPQFTAIRECLPCDPI